MINELASKLIHTKSHQIEPHYNYVCFMRTRDPRGQSVPTQRRGSRDQSNGHVGEGTIPQLSRAGISHVT